MPRIRAATLGAHHDLMWARLIRAFNELSAERDESLITLRDVAERAGMARNTIYNYVKDKGELAAAAASSATSSLADQLVAVAQSDAPGPEVIIDVCDIILRSLQDPSVRAALRREASLSISLDRGRSPLLGAFREVEAVIERGIGSGEFAPVPNPALMVEFIAGMVGAAATRIARGDDDRDSLTADVGGAVLRMLGARATSTET